MFRVGLTGGIGSGKTLVCSILEKLNIPVYYADEAAKDLMNQSEELKKEIINLFGDEAYSHGKLDREYLAGSLFGNNELLNAMNSLVHPAVRKDFQQWTARQTEVPYVVEEAAILFESGAHLEMDFTVLIWAPEELRISRVMERDACDRESVQRRMKHQMPGEELRKLADHVITNDGQQMLLPQIIEMHNHLLKGNIQL